MDGLGGFMAVCGGMTNILTLCLLGRIVERQTGALRPDSQDRCA